MTSFRDLWIMIAYDLHFKKSTKDIHSLFVDMIRIPET